MVYITDPVIYTRKWLNFIRLINSTGRSRRRIRGLHSSNFSLYPKFLSQFTSISYRLLSVVGFLHRLDEGTQYSLAKRIGWRKVRFLNIQLFKIYKIFDF